MLKSEWEMRKWRQPVLTGVLRILVLRGSGEVGGWEDAAFFFFFFFESRRD